MMRDFPSINNFYGGTYGFLHESFVKDKHQYVVKFVDNMRT